MLPAPGRVVLGEQSRPYGQETQRTGHGQAQVEEPGEPGGADQFWHGGLLVEERVPDRHVRHGDVTRTWQVSLTA